jgi:hypothetical protein
VHLDRAARDLRRDRRQPALAAGAVAAVEPHQADAASRSTDADSFSHSGVVGSRAMAANIADGPARPEIELR